MNSDKRLDLIKTAMEVALDFGDYEPLYEIGSKILEANNNNDYFTLLILRDSCLENENLAEEYLDKLDKAIDDMKLIAVRKFYNQLIGFYESINF